MSDLRVGWKNSSGGAVNRSRLEQRQWLDMIREHVAAALGIEQEAFDEVPFNQHGGLGKAWELFGTELDGLLREVNERLAA